MIPYVYNCPAYHQVYKLGRTSKEKSGFIWAFSFWGPFESAQEFYDAIVHHTYTLFTKKQLLLLIRQGSERNFRITWKTNTSYNGLC